MDVRDRASSMCWWDAIDGHHALWDGERIPVTFAVCPTCGGRGEYVNPSIDSHGLSSDDFDADPDFADAYLSGAYNVRCGHCKGRNVVPVPIHKADQERVIEWEDGVYEWQSTMEAERRMGA